MQEAAQYPDTSLTTDDVEVFMAPNPEDDETVLLGDALEALAVDAEIDSVEAIPPEITSNRLLRVGRCAFVIRLRGMVPDDPA